MPYYNIKAPFRELGANIHRIKRTFIRRSLPFIEWIFKAHDPVAYLYQKGWSQYPNRKTKKIQTVQKNQKKEFQSRPKELKRENPTIHWKPTSSKKNQTERKSPDPIENQIKGPIQSKNHEDQLKKLSHLQPCCRWLFCCSKGIPLKNLCLLCYV